MMKIYIQDLSWRGCIVVVATSEAEARKLMQYEWNYHENETVQEYEIKDGFRFCNLGDS